MLNKGYSVNILIRQQQSLPTKEENESAHALKINVCTSPPLSAEYCEYQSEKVRRRIWYLFRAKYKH